MNRTLPRTTLLLFFLGACTSPPPPRPPPLEIALPPAASAGDAPSPPSDPALVSVAAVRAPLKLVLDGDLGEWGSLLPARERAPLPTPEKLPTTANQEPEQPLPSGPNPLNAASHLALAITGDALLIAADLGEPAREGIWLGIGSLAPAVLPVGEMSRGGFVQPFDCDFEQIYVGEGTFTKGKPNPPEVVAACHGLLARHAEFVAKHRARFARMLKIDRQGVHGVAADGSLVSIEGAKYALKPAAKGATVEIALPLTALPRLVEAPITTLRLVARAATTPRPEITPEQWVWVLLPEAASFEPYGEIRARSFELLNGHTYYAAGMSYQPGDPLHVESLHHADGASLVAAQEEALYKKLTTLGDVEIGEVSAYAPWLAVFAKGKLVGSYNDAGEGMNVDDFPPSVRKGVFPRDGNLHVISFSGRASSDCCGMRQPFWSALTIAPDGSASGAMEGVDSPMFWDEVEELASPDLDSFGLRGSTWSPDSKTSMLKDLVGVEVTWKWDASRKKYLGSARRIAVPKKPKAPKPKKKK